MVYQDKNPFGTLKFSNYVEGVYREFHVNVPIPQTDEALKLLEILKMISNYVDTGRFTEEYGFHEVSIKSHLEDIINEWPTHIIAKDLLDDKIISRNDFNLLKDLHDIVLHYSDKFYIDSFALGAGKFGPSNYQAMKEICDDNSTLYVVAIIAGINPDHLHMLSNVAW